MGCKRLNTDFFNFLEVVHSKKSASEEKKRINYYPFGLQHKGYNNTISSNGNSTAQKFGYNGIEYEESLGLNLYEMEFRTYDPAIGRFNGIDPVTHHSQGTSVAFDNNPIFWSDPSGADADCGGNCDENEQAYIVNGKYRTRAERNAANEDNSSDESSTQSNDGSNEKAAVLDGFINNSLSSANSKNSTSLHIFDGSEGREEKDAYKFMWNTSTMENKEVSSYISENAVYVLPWENNTATSSENKPSGMFLGVEGNKFFGNYINKENGFSTRKFRILAQVHTHPDHGDLTGADDNSFSKRFRVPVFIIHPKGVGYLYKFSSFLDKSLKPRNKRGSIGSKSQIFNGNISLRKRATQILRKKGML